MGLLWYPLSFLGAFQHWNLQWWAEFFHRIHDLWQYLHHRQQQHQINVRRFQRGIFLNKEPSCTEATLKVSTQYSGWNLSKSFRLLHFHKKTVLSECNPMNCGFSSWQNNQKRDWQLCVKCCTLLSTNSIYLICAFCNKRTNIIKQFDSSWGVCSSCPNMFSAI